MPLILTLYITLCLLIGTIGAGRRIGFFSAFIFSLLLTPILGWLITLAYPKLEKTETPASPYDKLLKLGMKSYQQGNYDAAIKIFDDTILKFNTKPEAYLRLGAVYAKKGEVDLAIKNVAKAKKLGVNSLELVSKEPFDSIRNTHKWIDFVKNDYQISDEVKQQNISTTDELLKLGELVEKGLLTKEEFDTQKAKILKNQRYG